MNSSVTSRARRALAAMALVATLTAMVIAIPAAITNIPVVIWGGAAPLPARRDEGWED